MSSRPHPFLRVLLWILSVLIAAYGIVYFTGGTLPTIDIPAIFATPTPTATPKPTPRPTATPRPTTKSNALSKPENGDYFGHAAHAGLLLKRTSELTITTPSGNRYYCIVLVSADNPSRKLCSIFMRPGRTTTVKVLPEKALVYYTSAPTTASWYGYIDYFGDAGSWSTSDDVFDFSEYTWEITLQQVTNGNWDTDPISTGKVPFLD